MRVHIYEFLSPDVTHALLDALDRGIEVTLVLEEGILDSSSVSNSQRGHASALDEAGALVYWMVDPSGMSSPFTYILSTGCSLPQTSSINKEATFCYLCGMGSWQLVSS